MPWMSKIKRLLIWLPTALVMFYTTVRLASCLTGLFSAYLLYWNYKTIYILFIVSVLIEFILKAPFFFSHFNRSRRNFERRRSHLSLVSSSSFTQMHFYIFFFLPFPRNEIGVAAFSASQFKRLHLHLTLHLGR